MLWVINTVHGLNISTFFKYLFPEFPEYIWDLERLLDSLIR